jgi:DNA-directed RNA polymerase specialized sigma24 family protein
MHRRLVGYFQRKRCVSPVELADETLNRVARRLSEEGTIEDAAPAQYCYIVARFVFLEYWRASEQQREATALGEPARISDRPDDSDDDRQERRFRCLDRCLDRLPPNDQVLIRDYYEGDRSTRIARRRDLARRLALSANALMLKASRIRHILERCVMDCCGSDDRPGSFLSQQEEE